VRVASALGAAALLMLTGAAATQEARMTLHNRAEQPIFHVYIAPVAVPNWGSDRLASDETIAPDAVRDFAFDPVAPCRFDIRLDFADGTSAETRGIDLCTHRHVDARPAGIAPAG
jgi:hypothetical protein